MSKKFQVRVHVQAQDESKETVLVNYLNSKSTLYPLQHMAMIALRCYWLPLACLDNSSITKENRNRVILDCIYRIQLQIQDFQEMLETTPAESSLVSVQATGATTASSIRLGVDVVKKLRVRFQVQAQDESLEAVLLDYLTSRNAPYPFDDMAINALRSFWLPFAYRDSKSSMKSEKDKVIQDCIDRLKLQKQYLQEMLAPTTVESGVGPNESSPVTDQAHESAPELATVVADVVVVDGAIKNEEIWDPYENQ